MREEIRVEMEKVVKEYEAFFEEVDDIEEASDFWVEKIDEVIEKYNATDEEIEEICNYGFDKYIENI